MRPIWSIALCFIFIFALGFQSSQADEPLPSVEVLFREAHEHVLRVRTLQFESVTEFTASNGAARALQRTRLHYSSEIHSDDGQTHLREWEAAQQLRQPSAPLLRMDVMSNGASVRDSRFDQMMFFQNDGCYRYLPGEIVVIERNCESRAWEFSHDLWLSPYRWLNQEPAAKGQAERFRQAADAIESGNIKPGDAAQFVLAHRPRWNSFQDWKTWEACLPQARMVRGVEHRGRKTYVVELNVGKPIPLEVWFIRQPACFPVLVAGPDKQGDRTIIWEATDLITVETNPGIVVIPSQANVGSETERLLPETLRVNQPLPREIVQLPPIPVRTLIDSDDWVSTGIDGQLRDLGR